MTADQDQTQPDAPDRYSRLQSEVERLTREREETRAAFLARLFAWHDRCESAERALREIRDKQGKVCDHRACRSSYTAWAIADRALSSESEDVPEGEERCPGCGAEPGDEHDHDAHLETEWRMETGSRDPQGPPIGWRPRRRVRDS